MMSCVLIKFAIKFVIIDIKHAHYQQNLNKCFNHSNTLAVWVEICSPNARLICVQAVWKCVCIMAHISSIRIIMIITFVTLYRLLTSIIFKFSSWEEKNMFIHHLKWSYLSFSLREHLKYKHFFIALNIFTKTRSKLRIQTEKAFRMWHRIHIGVRIRPRLRQCHLSTIWIKIW